MKSAGEIRNEFLTFFQGKGHTVVPSDSLVPANDATLLFTNAGMNQFKDVFLGEGSREYSRATDTQKCLRVSGKHNDLEEVGLDTYHHTFFEMLGNWSFGDYFKKEAIRWAWELLVDVWGLDPDRLYVTVHEGDAALGLSPDEEAADCWRSETSIPHDHILYGSSKDNFWMMGDSGPCGPCSEIHIDIRSDEDRKRVSGIDRVNKDDAGVIEIWNLVFIQYNAQKEGGLSSLPAQHVDTGLGLERVVAILQGKSSNYDTDLFMPLLDRAAALSPIEDLKSYADPGGDSSEERQKRLVALRVIADHIRTVVFAIADGAAPGNVGRAYVIRRILRRAVRYGYQTLGFRTPFLTGLVATVVEVMGDQFSELEQNASFIERIVKAEEESFLETLGKGLQYFEPLIPYIRRLSEKKSFGDALDMLGNDRTVRDLLRKAWPDDAEDSNLPSLFAEVARGLVIPGEIAFLLHDTYGFPIDLTQLMAREEGLSVEMDRYNELMDGQKTRARSAAVFSVDMSSSDVWETVSQGIDSEFVGYESDELDGISIRALRRVRGDDDTFEIILDSTPFYAESGGQVGDTGILTVGEDVLKVLDTRKVSGKIIHRVDRLPEDASLPASGVVDRDRRKRIIKHHSVTHLLHAALREELGSHVSQKGSLVAPDHLRFDFSHFERMTPDALRRVECRVNEVIQSNIVKNEDRNVPIKEALSRGAMALFGEKYGDVVRVITFDPSYSVELCGGLHVSSTGEIGIFKFVSEGSVAAGVRRVEAVAGTDALGFIFGQLDELSRVRSQFKSLQRPSDEEVADIVSANRRLEKALEKEQGAALEHRISSLVDESTLIGDISLVRGALDNIDMAQLRFAGESLRSKLGDRSVAVLGSRDADAGKVYLVCSVSDDLTEKRGLNAGALVGHLAKALGGGGGGRPGFATAGGKNPQALDVVLEGVPAVIGDMLS